MDRAPYAAFRRGAPGAAARGRGDSLEARLGHPVFGPYRPWLERLGNAPSLALLNSFSADRQIKTESGKPIRFVPPAPSNPYYEVHLFETGEVSTRPENNHDLFNALVWLAFPRTKARINAMHAREIPKEGGKRGRLRDMLTIFDEGGAIVVGDAQIEALVRAQRWAELFGAPARLRVVVVGHAVLEQALAPYAGITCKVIFADPSQDLDAHCAEWLATRGSSPRDLPPLRVFGLPALYPVKSRPGAGQAVAVSQDAEESPGSIERDAG